jgi:hypothetical protein
MRGLASLGLLVATVSRADSRVDLSLRVGLALPAGNFSAGGANLGDWTGDELAAGVGARYLLTPQIGIGVDGQLGFSVTNADPNPHVDVCSMGIDCSGLDWRLGLLAGYDFAPGARLDPWLSVGVGYESLRAGIGAQNPGQPAPLRTLRVTRGGSYAALDGGLDVAVEPTVRVGPFVSFTVGQSSTTSVDPSSAAGPAQPDFGTSTHYWLLVGIRARAGL